MNSIEHWFVTYLWTHWDRTCVFRNVNNFYYQIYRPILSNAKNWVWNWWMFLRLLMSGQSSIEFTLHHTHHMTLAHGNSFGIIVTCFLDNILNSNVVIKCIKKETFYLMLYCWWMLENKCNKFENLLCKYVYIW